MSKNVMLTERAYAALLKHKHKRKDKSFSGVIKRQAPSPLGAFGDLEKYLENLEGPLFSDFSALDRVKARKKRANAQ